MSDAVLKPPGDRDWWTRPRIVLPLVGALVVLVALLTPQHEAGRAGDPRLSSHLTGPLGARVLSQMAERFGYSVVRRDDSPIPRDTAGRTIHALLAPRVEVTDREAHVYLDAVRRGDALLFVFEGRSALTDSLRLRPTPGGHVLAVANADVGGCDRWRDLTPSLWVDGRVHLLGVRAPDVLPERTTFAPLTNESFDNGATSFGAVGFALGRGRVVAVADPDLLRNDVLRRCVWGADVIAMRMLEWLRAGGAAPRNILAFDEYHQGFGDLPTARSLLGGFLVHHPVGRAILVLAAGGLALLIAAAPRPLVPRDSETIERRDPLEQIDALAHAYEQVDATRTATARLLHGVRTRLSVGSSRHLSDDDFLAAAAVRAPERGADVALIRRALRERVSARDLSDVGDALRRLEDSLSTSIA